MHFPLFVNYYNFGDNGMIVTSICAVGTYLCFSTLRLFVPTILLSIHCHYTPVYIYATSLLIFHPFPKKNHAALVASKHSKHTGGDSNGSQNQNRAGSQTGWDPCRPGKHSRLATATATERNWELTVWTYPFKYTRENFTERWRSAAKRKRNV